MDNDAYGETEEGIDLSHPLGVAFGEVVVHGDDMHATASEGIEINRQSGDEGFSFAGFHFGDFALVQHHATDHLHVEVTHVEHAAPSFADDNKGFGEDFLENFFERGLLGCFPGIAGVGVIRGGFRYTAEAFVNLFAEVEGLGAKLFVGQRSDGLVQGGNLVENGLEALDLALVLGPENLGCNGVNQCGKSLQTAHFGHQN